MKNNIEEIMTKLRNIHFKEEIIDFAKSDNNHQIANNYRKNYLKRITLICKNEKEKWINF